MSNDYDGIVDYSRLGQQQATSQDARGIAKEDEGQHQKPAQSGSVDERLPIQNEKELNRILDGLSPEDRSQIEGLIAVQYEETHWIGVLPDPVSFAQYPAEVQNRLLAWNDAQIIDESKRSDKLVDAFINHNNRNQLFNFLIHIVFTVAALVAFLITHDPASFGFLAIPGVTIAINVWQNNKKDKE